jgi:tRNA-specific 2-thiouridylase
MLNSLDIAKPANETRVVVAMSGGVDSSVVAGILAKEGYDVIGITLQLYDHGTATFRKGACCSGQDIDDAKRVAAQLNIPHYVLDYEKRFAQAVINPFAEAYARGETPVPCITCNQSVKFEDLMSEARQLGADILATGHYVQTKLTDVKKSSSRRQLLRPIDNERDQSYFLFATTPSQLDFLRFPLGGLPKSKVRELAHEMGLEIADKQDSQDICFVPMGKYGDVIRKLKPESQKKGDIIHLDGRVLGVHEGIINYTIGQRKGLGIAAPEPLYVVRLDAKKNQVIVGGHNDLKSYTVKLRDVNWLGEGDLKILAAGNGMAIHAKLRSTRAPQSSVIQIINDEIYVTLVDGEHGISPGQACVFYSDESNTSEVLGGGFIVGANNAN